MGHARAHRHCVRLLIAVGFLAWAIPAGAGRIYVKADATGNNDGSSWTDAYTDLQSALAAAVIGDSIWTAAGTYRPTATTDRFASFQLKSMVAVLGGFAGTETDIAERDIASSPTTLSGDIGVAGNLSDNSFHVVRAGATDSTAVLDGFIVTKGNASVVPDGIGGGLLTGGGSPTISNVVFEDNWAYGGAGCYNSGAGAPAFVNVVFRNNSAVYGVSGGGGMQTQGGSPRFRNVLFTGNTSRLGGGFHNYNSQSVFVNCVFHNNVATDPPDEEGWGGAIYQANATLTLLNCTFVGNRADYSAGGLYNAGYGEAAAAVVRNCIFWDNFGAGMIDEEIVNSSGGLTTVDHSLVKGCVGSGPLWALGSVDGGGNIDEDPRFADQENGDFRVLFASPAMEAGDNAAPGLPGEDFEGKPRIIGDTVDMGAYETEILCPPGNVFYVNANAAGTETGISWADATRELRHALRVVRLCGNVSEVWVATGTYEPGAPAFVNDTFPMMNNLALYGGFDGTETAREERDWIANPTVLSGNNGGPGDIGRCYHVVTASDVDSTGVLDGFTITGGKATNSPVNANGGGVLVIGGNPTIRRIVFSGNEAVSGGGLHVEGGRPSLEDFTFTGNLGQMGGGLSIASPASCVLTDAVFNGNVASLGGGVVNQLADLTLVNAIFTSNEASNGGGIFNQAGDLTLANAIFFDNIVVNSGGALYNAAAGTALVTNAVFHANTASSGGGMYNLASSPVISNTILWGNTATTGSEIGNVSGSVPAISHCLIQGSGGSGAGWNTVLGTDGGGNIDEDPLFVDGPNGDFHLATGSPAIDSGDNAAPGLPGEDIEGQSRILGEFVDMGPYESYVGVGIGGETGDIPSLAFPSVYPNPFNPTATIVIELDRRRQVELSVYDVQGRRVRALHSAAGGPGRLEIEWNALDDRGSRVASGVYFIEAVSESWRQTRKVAVLK